MDRKMYPWAKAVLGVAGLAAAMGAARADALRASHDLTSFGAQQTIVAQPFLVAGPAVAFTPGDFASNNFLLCAGALPRSAFAASLALSPDFAIDSGYNIDVAQRFDDYGGMKSPLLPGADFLSL